MPDTAEPTATEILIDRAFSRRAEIAALEAEQAADEALIIALGKGKHSGADPAHAVTVVAASPSAPGKVFYAFPDDAEKAKSAEETARQLAGVAFNSLFDRRVIFTPCAGIENVSPKLLTPARSRDLLALLAQTGRGFAGKKAHILWPK